MTSGSWMKVQSIAECSPQRMDLELLCPGHDNGRGIKCYRRPLSNPNIFYQNFMKLGDIV